MTYQRANGTKYNGGMRAIALVVVLCSWAATAEPEQLRRPPIGAPVAEIVLGAVAQTVAAGVYAFLGDTKTAGIIFAVGLMPLIGGAIWLATTLWARAQLE